MGFLYGLCEHHFVSELKNEVLELQFVSLLLKHCDCGIFKNAFVAYLPLSLTVK